MQRIISMLFIFLMVLTAQSEVVFASDSSSSSFSLGDAKKGRETFLKYDCYVCHQVSHDPLLPAKYGHVSAPILDFNREVPKSLIEQKEAEFRKLHHLPERDERVENFIMAIVNPSHAIAPGYGKGSAEDEPVSDMPDFVTEMTIQEMRDIVAYLIESGDGDENGNL